jgi:N,N'-diacetyllegionaminate synthase
MKKTYIIAEVGPNHQGSFLTALEMVRRLSAIGVDAVKFQLNFPENSYSDDSFKPRYQIENDATPTQIEMSKKLQLSISEHKELSNFCKVNKVDYLCSAFEMKGLEFLTTELEMPYYKIPSGEILTLDILEYIGKHDKPILLSTGMASYDEIQESLAILNKGGVKDITVLHCISNYPTPPADVNLSVMLQIKEKFRVPVGFSDHTVGNEASIAAVALGAVVIEKHVTFDRFAEGPDHKASSTIEEFEELVKSIRKVDQMMGSTEKSFSEDELEIRKSVRKSIVSTKNLPVGHVIAREDLCFKRPGFGIKPTELQRLIGKRLILPVDINRVILPEAVTDA